MLKPSHGNNPKQARTKEAKYKTRAIVKLIHDEVFHEPHVQMLLETAVTKEPKWINDVLQYLSLIHISLEQLQIYKHTKTNKNDILNEQTQFKSHVSFEHITPYAHNFLSLIHI